MHPALVVAALVAIAAAALMWRRQAAMRREDFIRHAELPKGLFERLRAKHPQLGLKDCQLVAHGLRQFFLAYLKGGRRFVSMPSQVVDDLWHEFILHTRHYDLFCRRAFGRFLHHAPAAILTGDRRRNEGLRRVWWQACREENIDPRAPTRLPLLFALDAKLDVADGFRYVPDCGGVRRAAAPGAVAGASAATYCGGDFGSTSFDGGTAGFGDGGGDGSGGGGIFGGDGGGSDGCGGGCGGGGCGGD